MIVASSTQAFDALAPDYDAQFSAAANPLIGMIRERTHAAVTRHVAPGATILEIGCGTGEDTVALVERGYRLVAVDPAPGMLARARTKVTARFGPGAVRFVEATASGLAARWPIPDAPPTGDPATGGPTAEADAPPTGGPTPTGAVTDVGRGAAEALRIDAVLSNFAPLNCEPDLAPVGALLRAALPPGGVFVATVLPRLCPWEIALFLARGMPRTALRRFGLRLGDAAGVTFPVRYLGAADFAVALGPGFELVEARSLGLFLPPLSFGPSFARVPGLLAALGVLEDHLGALPGLRRMGDHLLLAWRRRA